jgi:hypothetical protein
VVIPTEILAAASLVPIAAAETTTAAAKGYDVIFEPDANTVCGVSQFSPYLFPHT